MHRDAQDAAGEGKKAAAKGKGLVVATFKPHQSRAFYASDLPVIVLARDSFPAFGEAKRTSD